MAELPRLLDRVDAWMDARVLGEAAPNVADPMTALSLALMDQLLAELTKGREA